MSVPPRRPSKRAQLAHVPLALLAIGAGFLLLTPLPALAIGTAVDLGTADTYAVLAGQTVTNTGNSVLDGDVGVSPGSAITGFPPGILIDGGVFHAADAAAAQAQSDLTIAYNDAAGQASDASVGSTLGGLTLVPGVYTATSSASLTGPLTLDAQGDPGAVFIFQIGSSLTTASASSVVLLNDAQACNVFWQVGASATLGTNSSFVGTILALTSVTVTTGATVEGRALARNAAVTLDNNVFSEPGCATVSTTPAPTPTDTATATSSGTSTATVTSTGTPTATAAGTETIIATATSTGESTIAPTSTDSATAAGAGDETSGGDDSGRLALTGGGIPGPLIAIAVCAAVVGGILMWLGRRRHRTA